MRVEVLIGNKKSDVVVLTNEGGLRLYRASGIKKLFFLGFAIWAYRVWYADTNLPVRHFATRYMKRFCIF